MFLGEILQIGFFFQKMKKREKKTCDLLGHLCHFLK
jgi:hypothetical protein